MLRPSRAFLFLGAVLGLALPFADGLAHAGLAGFLKGLDRDSPVWTIAGRLIFLLIFGIASLVPVARTDTGWIFVSLSVYGVAAVTCFLSLFTGREPLFQEPLDGAKVFLLLIPAAAAFHLLTLVLRGLPWPLAGFWARVDMAGLILLAGAIHAAEPMGKVGGWLAVATGTFLIAGEILARREEAFEEDARPPEAGAEG